MNKKLNLTSFLILLFGVIACNAEETRPDSKMTDKVKEIIKKSNKALKIDKYRAVKSTESTLKLSIPQMKLNGSINIKSQINKILVTSKLSSMHEEQGYNGKTAWSNNIVTGFRTLAGGEKFMLTSQTLYNSLWIEKLYDEIKLVGEEVYKGKKCFKLALIKKDVDTAYQFVNSTTYMIEGRIDIVVTPQGKVKVANTILAYAEHKNGFKYPSKFSQVMGPMTLQLSVETFKVNPELKDSLFNPPAQ